MLNFVPQDNNCENAFMFQKDYDKKLCAFVVTKTRLIQCLEN